MRWFRCQFRFKFKFSTLYFILYTWYFLFWSYEFDLIWIWNMKFFFHQFPSIWFFQNRIQIQKLVNWYSFDWILCWTQYNGMPNGISKMKKIRFTFASFDSIWFDWVSNRNYFASPTRSSDVIPSLKRNQLHEYDFDLNYNCNLILTKYSENINFHLLFLLWSHFMFSLCKILFSISVLNFLFW